MGSRNAKFSTGCRLNYISATRIGLTRWSGIYAYVNNQQIAVDEGEQILNTTDTLINSSGVETGAGMAADTLYYVYLCNEGVLPGLFSNAVGPRLRASTQAPTFIIDPEGGRVPVLGSSGAALNWGLMGYALPGSTVEFSSTSMRRDVVSYYNRIAAPIVLNPGYVDDNADTTYTIGSATWILLNAGVDARFRWISTGEDTLTVQLNAVVSVPALETGSIGIGFDSDTTAIAACESSAITAGEISCGYSAIPAAGAHFISLLGACSGGVMTVYADRARLGGTVDAIQTALIGTCFV